MDDKTLIEMLLQSIGRIPGAMGLGGESGAFASKQPGMAQPQEEAYAPDLAMPPPSPIQETIPQQSPGMMPSHDPYQQPTITNMGGGGVRLEGSPLDGAGATAQPGGALHDNQGLRSAAMATQMGQNDRMSDAINELLMPKSKYTETDGGGYLRNEIDPQSAQIAGALTKIMGDAGLDRERMDISRQNLDQMGPLRNAQAEYYSQGRQDPLEAQFENIIRSSMSGMSDPIASQGMQQIFQKAIAGQAALASGDRPTAERLFAEIAGAMKGSEKISEQEVAAAGGQPFSAEQYRTN